MRIYPLETSYKMDIMTKNEDKIDSQRLQTFKITFANMGASTRDLRDIGIKNGVYVSMSDSALLKQGLLFLKTSVKGFEKLPTGNAELTGKSKQLAVWNAIIANPSMDSKQIQEIVGVGTTERVAISWLGSVVEFLSTIEEYSVASKAFLAGHKCLSERTRGGRQPNPENRAKRDKIAQERAITILNNYSLDQLNTILALRNLHVVEIMEEPVTTTPKPASKSASKSRK